MKMTPSLIFHQRCKKRRERSDGFTIMIDCLYCTTVWFSLFIGLFQRGKMPNSPFQPVKCAVMPDKVIIIPWLKWYYDDNPIFSIAAILKHKQVACVRRSMRFTIFKYSQQNFDQIWRISQPICIRNVWFFACKMFDSLHSLSVPHNMSLTIWLPWQRTGFQTFPLLKAFLAIFGVPFWYLQMIPHMLDPAIT